ncbi:MAG: PIN domain-containing protein [Candidatus Adiutrix sp.]|jgi:predicted nucleic acid-binding protein|nr:PIN domain-containing protein [Candidatus Adiutrix sp.]
MKAVIDTNVVMDVLTNREPFVGSSESVLSLAAKNKLQAAITANTITDIAYLLRKHRHDLKIVKSSLASLMELLDVIEVSKDCCVKALNVPLDDYEDALLAECAGKWGAELIITRDLDDFINSPVKAASPDDFLKKHDPSSTDGSTDDDASSDLEE